HRDEKLTTPAEAVKMIVEAAHILGRQIATPDEARKIMGISLDPVAPLHETSAAH
ncbi:MAG: 3-keto-5-aminohexanoate cleavage protein, partial [Burkholderiales bacterium]